MGINQTEIEQSTRSKPTTANPTVITRYDIKGQATSSQLRDDIYAEKQVLSKSQICRIRITNHNVPANPYESKKGKFTQHIIRSSGLDDRLVEVSQKAFEAYLKFLQTGEINLLGIVRKENYAKYL